MAGRPIFLGFYRTPYKRCFYLLLYKKKIKFLMTGRNQAITPHVRNYRRSQSNNSIELSMMIASTIPGISMNPIIAIAQDTVLAIRVRMISNRGKKDFSRMGEHITFFQECD
ncbi:hypothetical protein NitaMp115 (mitochondrion) [Nicotiana tabacum]|uniref:Uncharacterized protein n=1 Tax=Nicotiana tabacum TaxID=4097 RepID=Q5M9W0_TOBAC|nr:hypothetical protein NitaMp115 [Nicotiana tabacum]BAD83518.1 hypothetical protein [Nicotiana tabacum]